MTPFIDVMLVLLIIFMVAAPLLATGVPIDLPQTKAAPLNIEQKPLAVSIDDKGAIFLADAPTTIGQLPTSCRRPAKAGFDERIYVRGSKKVPYGRVAEVMTPITSAGYKKVALVTDRKRSERIATLKFSWSEPGIAISAAAARGLLLFALIAFSNAKKFDDAQETMAIDTITSAEFNKMMKGDKAAKEVTPHPKPKVDKVAQANRAEASPPTPTPSSTSRRRRLR